MGHRWDSSSPSFSTNNSLSQEFQNIEINIEKRKTKDGKDQYRVKIRLKGYPPQTATFGLLKKARRWAQDTESAKRHREPRQIPASFGK